MFKYVVVKDGKIISGKYKSRAHAKTYGPRGKIKAIKGESK